MGKIKVRELPGKIRARAEFYMKIEGVNAGAYNLDQAFIWFDTKEKKKFWQLVNKRDWKGAYNERPELREEFYIKGMWRSNDIRWEWFIANINYKREKARKSRVIGNGGDFIYCSNGNIHMAHEKGFRDSAEHLRWIISELERGFVTVANVEQSNFK